MTHRYADADATSPSDGRVAATTASPSDGMNRHSGDEPSRRRARAKTRPGSAATRVALGELANGTEVEVSGALGGTAAWGVNGWDALRSPGDAEDARASSDDLEVGASTNARVRELGRVVEALRARVEAMETRRTRAGDAADAAAAALTRGFARAKYAFTLLARGSLFTSSVARCASTREANVDVGVITDDATDDAGFLADDVGAASNGDDDVTDAVTDADVGASAL
ncbi:unnamed product [Ostreococcus tauri]|uniref:Unnamed product n=1 Tax=Ostreococcus tauri TaxID=70448 RepID=A0A090M7D3_OSTTA|nr:unnamed product [Ostreococcus tauri]CEF98597.1 unnamed product [Ostreococcus tauri]|eukprot:XP_022839360.1 unnamed product [Ostreococcus tauri]